MIIARSAEGAQCSDWGSGGSPLGPPAPALVWSPSNPRPPPPEPPTLAQSPPPVGALPEDRGGKMGGCMSGSYKNMEGQVFGNSEMH